MKHNLVVLGGGYAGLTAASRLRRLLPGATITLVDAAPSFVERIRLHEAAVGQHLKRWSYADFLAARNMRFLQARVTELNPADSTVTVDGADGSTSHLQYDFLVYALGSTIDVSSTPGAEAFALPVNSLESVGRIQRLMTDGPESRVVVGALA